ncbi:MAG: hypothetical protein HDS35_09895 [Bacteroides sp.]|nr:hypothetical protein [Bacteroides sp.]
MERLTWSTLINIVIYSVPIIAFFLIILKLREHLIEEEIDKKIREYQSMYDVTGGKQITVEDGRIIIK